MAAKPSKKNASHKAPSNHASERGPVLDHERTISALVNILANKLTGGSSTLYRREFDLGATEWRIMAFLAIRPWSTPQAMCQEIGFDKAVVSRSVKALEARELILIRPNPNKVRSLELALSKSGFVMHDRIVQVALEREKRLMSCLTAQEIDTTIKVLTKLLGCLPFMNAPIDIPE